MNRTSDSESSSAGIGHPAHEGGADPVATPSGAADGRGAPSETPSEPGAPSAELPPPGRGSADAADDRHHRLLAGARRKLDRKEPLDEITHHRLVQKNNQALADLRSILAPTPPPPRAG